MTSDGLHAATGVVTPPMPATDLNGGAPQGMWWVAWRQHRLHVAVLLGVMALLAAALVAFRLTVLAAFTANGCDVAATACAGPNGTDIWWNDGYSDASPLLHLAMMAASIVLGVFAGATIFTHEFAHRTHVFALTQSVGTLRWWAVKMIVVALPLVAGLLVLGILTGWMDAAVGYTVDRSLRTDNFLTRGFIPAVLGLVFFAIGDAAGIVTRSTVAALVAGLLVSIAAFAGLAAAQPSVLPADRVTQGISSFFQGQRLNADLRADDPDLKTVRSGYLDGDGDPMPDTTIAACFGTAQSRAAEELGLAEADGGGFVVPEAHVEEFDRLTNVAMTDCARDMGIAEYYQDYLPGSMLWPLRWAVTGICVILAALFLGVSAWRLKSAVAKR